MSANRELLEPVEPGPEPRSPRKRLGVLVAVALVVLLAAAAALFAVLRSDGGGDSEEVITEVTFGPEGDATSIVAPPPGSNPVIALDVESGPAGTEVTLQGVSFKAGKDFRQVELYWDKVDGDPLKKVDGPRFSTKLTIPEDAAVTTEGHNIIAVQRTKDNKVVSQTSVRFFVLPRR